MLKSIRFQNFRVLRDVQLELGRFTLLIGPNGGGKSTVLNSLRMFQELINFGRRYPQAEVATVQALGEPVQIEAEFEVPSRNLVVAQINWRFPEAESLGYANRSTLGPPADSETEAIADIIRRVRVFSLDSKAISASFPLRPGTELGDTGTGLSVVLDQLRDTSPERFEALNDELARWLPEFDQVLFETPEDGKRAIALRTSAGKQKIPAASLSDGTLLALAMLTLAYLPSPPSILCIEEPDRGIHPRLLQDVRDALYRLSYPEAFGEPRAPVQVIATTHSPYMLDLFSEHPEEIVIANKIDGEAKFERLSDRGDLAEILNGVQLGDVWFSGVLGGVPWQR
jgi:predicted ATPase